jgi:hypothetical protein
MLSTVLIVLLIMLVIGALPRWGYSRTWGYAPSGVVGLVAVVVILLVLFDQL